MESGLFSSADFAEFTSQVVPFLHVTTRIEDRPYEDLLSKFGFPGFPSMAFLDGEGRMLAPYTGPRTIKGFEQGLKELKPFLDLQERAAKGDAAAATELLIRQLEMKWFDYDEAKRRVEALGKVSSKHKKALDQLLLDTEVRQLAKDAGDDRTKRLAAGARCAELFDEKMLPGTIDERASFWLLIADHAEAKGDKRLMKKVIAGFDDTLPNSVKKRNTVRALEERLDRF